MTRRLIRLSTGLYRRLTALLPRRDRRLRDEIAALFERQVAEAGRRRGLRGALDTIFRAYLDLAGWIVRGRLRRHDRGPRNRARPLESLLEDLRFGARSLLSRPLLSLGICLTLALAIGATTALFSVADTVLRRPLPFADDHELVRVYLIRNGQPPHISPRAPVVVAVRDGVPAFESVAGQRLTTLTLTTDEGPQRVLVGAVTAGWLDTLGMEPSLGRGFTAQEERTGQESGVVMISHAFWQERFAGDPDTLGRSVLLDDDPYTVVGVLPPGFAYPYANDLYLPLDPVRSPGGRWAFNLQARLRDGVGVEVAREQLRGLSERLRGQVEGLGPDVELTAVPTREVLLDNEEGQVTGLFGAVGFLLLIACANVASLLLARSRSRRHELAVRSALGAGRWRQVRQLATESLLLAAVAGVGGIVLAAWTRDLLHGLLPGRLGNLVGEIPLDAGILAFAAGASVLTGLLFGIPLALRNSDLDPTDAFRGHGRSGASRGELRLLDGFVVLQLALVTALLGGAGVMVGNLLQLQSADLGYDPDGVVTLQVALEGERYAAPDVRNRFVTGVLERVRSGAGIREAGATTIFPSAQGGNNVGAIRTPEMSADDTLAVNTRMVTPGFLEALDVPLLRGRLLEAGDGADAAPVAVLSRRAAERLFPGRSPVGELVLEGRDGGAEPVRVVGVVEDVKEMYELDATWYLPYAQRAGTGTAASVILTARGVGTEPAVRSLREAVWEVDPSLPVFNAATAADLYRETLEGERFGAWLVAGFAGAGLLLAALGLYSLVAFGVSRRTSELGLRLAVGARPTEITRQILRRGLVRVAVGSALGLVGMVATSRMLGSMLGPLESPRLDVMAAVILILGGVCVLASWLPARRAARLDPVQALGPE